MLNIVCILVELIAKSLPILLFLLLFLLFLLVFLNVFGHAIISCFWLTVIAILWLFS
jgi:hypothetical protein